MYSAMAEPGRRRCLRASCGVDACPVGLPIRPASHRHGIAQHASQRHGICAVQIGAPLIVASRAGCAKPQTVRIAVFLRAVVWTVGCCDCIAIFCAWIDNCGIRILLDSAVDRNEVLHPATRCDRFALSVTLESCRICAVEVVVRLVIAYRRRRQRLAGEQTTLHGGSFLAIRGHDVGAQVVATRSCGATTGPAGRPRCPCRSTRCGSRGTTRRSPRGTTRRSSRGTTRRSPRGTTRRSARGTTGPSRPSAASRPSVGFRGVTLLARACHQQRNHNESSPASLLLHRRPPPSTPLDTHNPTTSGERW